MQSIHPNGVAALLSWQEAMGVIHALKGPLLCITGYCPNGLIEQSRLDLDHIWDLKKTKLLAFDYMLQTLGVAETFTVEY